MSFHGRSKQHDEIATPYVIGLFNLFDFECFQIGTEIDDTALHSALRCQSDRTSIMLRFRPDQVFVNRGFRSLLCEIKSEGKGYDNFSIEVDSYKASCEWNTLYNHVMYTFVELSPRTKKPVKAVSCWCNKIPYPQEIRVPKRWDWEDNYKRMAAEWPKAIVRPINHQGGSGTPYFLIPKIENYLIPFNEFVQTEIFNISFNLSRKITLNDLLTQYSANAIFKINGNKIPNTDDELQSVARKLSNKFAP